MNILHIDSSPLGSHSVSRQLTAHAVANLVAKHAGANVEHLDLAKDAPNHLTTDALAPRLGVAEADLSPAQRAENAVTERLLQQFLSADVVVIGAPMYNFSVPSQLKAWCDRIAQAGRTFEYTATGPKGFFAFLGVTDVQVVRAEGLNTGPDPRQQAIASAQAALA